MKALMEYIASPCTQHFMLNGRCEASFGGYCPKKSQITNKET